MENYICINGKTAELTDEQLRKLGLVSSCKNGTLNGLSWDEIKEMARDKSKRGSIGLHDVKEFRIGNEEVAAEIIGFDHDGDGTITFALVDCMEEDHRMNRDWFNEGGWHCCEMRKYLNNDVYSGLPEDLRAAIASCVKDTGIGAAIDGKIASHDKLFLFSEAEVFGETRFSVDGEGTPYEGFQDIESRIKRDIDGDASIWWLRSPSGSIATNFCGVTSSGTANGYGASAANGVAFGFVI